MKKLRVYKLADCQRQEKEDLKKLKKSRKERRGAVNKVRRSILVTFITLFIVKTAVAGSGFDPVISEAVNDVINKTVDKGTIDKTSDRLSKLGDIYGTAKAVPESIKETAGGTKTTEVKGEKKGLTFWQKIDRLILRTRNSNY